MPTAASGVAKTRRRMAARWWLTAVAVTAVAAAMAGPAGAGPTPPGVNPVEPHQVFGALVNGKNGSTTPVPIRMACFGPIVPGETGHPLKGQNVSVFQPEVITGSFGNTGAQGTEIDAFFGPLPPAASAGPVIFHRYVTKPIPTSLLLPCSGTGHVSFIPLPMSPGTSKDVVVPVVYVGQP